MRLSPTCQPGAVDASPTGGRAGGTRAVARMPVLVVPAGLVLLAEVLSALTDHAAVHLCGWPAMIACDPGVPVVWSVLVGGLRTVGVVATVDAALFVRAPSPPGGRRLLWWAVWGPAVAVTTVVTMRDRTLGWADLVLGVGLVAVALGLLAWTASDRLSLPRPVLVAVLAVPMVAVVLLPAWAPVAFRWAEQAAPAREDAARREASRRCLANRAAGAVPAGEADVACEVYPESTDTSERTGGRLAGATWQRTQDRTRGRSRRGAARRSRARPRR